jgi:hypothetical protein
MAALLLRQNFASVALFWYRWKTLLWLRFYTGNN